MYGNFSESALEEAAALFDFTRCVRPDGSIYGTSGKCRKGTETGAKEVTPKTVKSRVASLSKNEKIAIKVMADKSLRSDKKRKAEMVRLGVPPDTDFVTLVGEARRKAGLSPNVTVWDTKKKPESPTKTAGKSLAERMAAAAEKLEKQQPAAPKAAPKSGPKAKKAEAPKSQEEQTAAAKVARPVDPKVAAKVNKAVAAKKAGPGYTPEQLAAQDKLLAQSQAKTKKPKETPEEKAEKKWLALQEKFNAIQKQRDDIRADLKEKGIKAIVGGEASPAFKNALKERGLPSDTQFRNLRTKLRETEPERLKQERIAEERRKIAEEITGTSRETRKGMILKELERLRGSSYIRTLKDVNNNVEMMQKWINEDPSMATLKNRVALTAMRALRAQMTSEIRRERQTKGVALDKDLSASPKYSQTPGSRKPANVETLTGEYGKLKKREKELDEERERMEKTGPFDSEWSDKYRDLLHQITEHSRKIPAGSPVTLEKIYETQGFNAKPELVRSRADLEDRKDIIREPDGRPLILYRGVTEENFARQFQGSGPDGDKHYPGRGVYGNGTYAASAGSERNSKVTGDNLDLTAQRTAHSYAGGGENSSSKVTAFALRSDANIVQFEESGGNSRYANYSLWSRSIIDQAEERFGVRFSDHGEAAAAMGIHAYRVPMSATEDYWVVLNRGAVIAAQDPQLPDV